MRGRTQPNLTEMFDQAVGAFDSALKAGVKMQEETSRWWADMMSESGSMQELQERSRMMIMEALPMAQKNMQQCMTMIDRTYHSSMDLIRKAMETTQAETIMEAQQKAQELWEATLSAVRTNAQAMIQINSNTMDTWANFMNREMPQMAESTAKAAQSASASVRSTTKHARRAARAAR